MRGPVDQLQSDRGSNFVGTRNELAPATKEMNVNKIASHYVITTASFFSILVIQGIVVKYGKGRLKPSEIH